MAEKSVVIRLRDGSEYGMASAAKAKAVYPDAKIVSYADGTPYVAPKPAAKKAPAKKQAETKEEAK